MRKIIEDKVFDTDTAEHISKLSCSAYRGDFGWHETSLYRSPQGRWFLAGRGNASSMWGKSGAGGIRLPGEGMRLPSDEEVREILAEEDMDWLIEEFFEVEEG